MKRIAIAALLALSGALFAQVATIETAGAATIVSIDGNIDSGTIVFGSSVIVTGGTVTGDGGSGTPTGTVTLRVDGGFDQTVGLNPIDGNTSSYGQVTFNGVAVNGSPHTISASYNPDGASPYDAFGPVSLGQVTVTKQNTSVSATPSNGNPTFGAAINVGGSVSGTAPFSGTVTITEGATTLGSGSVAPNGSYTSSNFNSLGVGSHTLTATYSGDSNHNGDTATTNVTVGAPATTITFSSGATTTYGAAYSVAGTVTSGAGAPGGSVAIKIDNGGTTAVPLDGAGKFSMPVGLLTRATHSIKVDYAANGNFAAGSATLTLTVNKAPVTVGATTPASSFPGQPIPVSVTVVPSGTLIGGVAPLTGTVTAPNSDGPKTLAAGAATVTLNPITANLNAAFSYSGDNNYAPNGLSKLITFQKYSLDMTIVDTGNCKSPGPSCANVPPGVPMPLRVVLTLTAGQPTPPAGMVPTGTIHLADSRHNAFWTPQDPGIVAFGSGWAANTIGQFPTAGQDDVSATYAGNGNFATVNNTTAPLQVGVPNSTHNERYVFWAFNDLLGRSPDSGGLSYWAGLLNAGTPRPTVAWALVNGTEYRSNVINGLYRRFLGRSADAAGLNYWVGQVGAGMSFEWFESFLAGSAEYYQRADKGNSNPQKFVTSMYTDVLGRGPDAAGLNFFTTQLNQGVSRPQVVSAIVFSRENLANTVNGYYVKFLSRSSDPSGLNYWVTQLQFGARDELIVALIVGSDEYFSLV